MSEPSPDTKKNRIALLIPGMMMLMIGSRLLGHPSRSAKAWDLFFSILGGVSMIAGLGVIWKAAVPNTRSAIVAGVAAALGVITAAAIILLSTRLR